MLHYAHELQSPITALHMLGVVLPIFVLLFGLNVLAKRPTGYGDSDILRENPQFKALEKTTILGTEVKPWFVGVLFGLPLIILGLMPIILHTLNPSFDFIVPGGKFLDYQAGNGPYEIGGA